MGASPTAFVLFHRRPTHIVPPHNNTYDDEIADPLSLLEQIIDV
jgi:hypothetical protein